MDLISLITGALVGGSTLFFILRFRSTGERQNFIELK